MIGIDFNYHHEPNQIRIKLYYAQKIRFDTNMEALLMVAKSYLGIINAQGLEAQSLT